jgi:hypothetical protein
MCVVSDRIGVDTASQSLVTVLGLSQEAVDSGTTARRKSKGCGRVGGVQTLLSSPRDTTRIDCIHAIACLSCLFWYIE